MVYLTQPEIYVKSLGRRVRRVLRLWWPEMKKSKMSKMSLRSRNSTFLAIKSTKYTYRVLNIQIHTSTIFYIECPRFLNNFEQNIFHFIYFLRIPIIMTHFLRQIHSCNITLRKYDKCVSKITHSKLQFTCILAASQIIPWHEKNTHPTMQ